MVTIEQKIEFINENKEEIVKSIIKAYRETEDSSQGSKISILIDYENGDIRVVGPMTSNTITQGEYDGTLDSIGEVSGWSLGSDYDYDLIEQISSLPSYDDLVEEHEADDEHDDLYKEVFIENAYLMIDNYLALLDMDEKYHNTY